MRNHLTTWGCALLLLCSIVFVSSAASSAVATDTTPAPVTTVGDPSPDINTLITILDKLNISSDQYHTLLLARDIGNKYGLGKTLMALTWQEDRAGALGPIGDSKAGFGNRSYGVCQVKRKTARKTVEAHPSLGTFGTDEELISRLMTDEKFNLQVAALILVDLRKQGLTWDQMVQTYNYGYTIKHPESAPYTKSVAAAMKTGVPAQVDAMQPAAKPTHNP